MGSRSSRFSSYFDWRFHDRAPSPLLGLTDVDKLNKSAIVLKRHSHASLFHRIPSFFFFLPSLPSRLIRASDGCVRFIKSLLSRRERFLLLFHGAVLDLALRSGISFFSLLSFARFSRSRLEESCRRDLMNENGMIESR